MTLHLWNAEICQQSWPKGQGQCWKLKVHYDHLRQSQDNLSCSYDAEHEAAWEARAHKLCKDNTKEETSQASHDPCVWLKTKPKLNEWSQVWCLSIALRALLVPSRISSSTQHEGTCRKPTQWWLGRHIWSYPSQSNLCAPKRPAVQSEINSKMQKPSTTQ